MREITTTERLLQAGSNLSNILRIGAYLAMLILLPIVAFKVLPIADRAVTVLENMDQRVQRAFEGAAPLGKEVITRSVKTVGEVDTEKLADELEGAARRFLRTGTSREGEK